MANEFIARKGLIVLANGVEVTGSSRFSTDVTSSGNVRATAFYGDGANVTGVISASYAVTASYVKAANVEGIITSASQATTASYALTASVTPGALTTASAVGSTITFTKGDGSTFPVTITVGNSATASYVEYTNVANKPTLVSASSQIDHNATTNYVANQHIDHSTVSISAGSGLSGGGDITTTRTLTLDTGSAHFTNGVVQSLPAGTYSSSAQLPAGTVSSSAQVVSALPAGTVSSSTQVVNALPVGTVSASSQVVATSITGIGAYATTASNSFTGVQTITDTTNSTTYADGALIVQGGVGIAKDVNISGSLNVTGLLTVVSMSTQYVTSSQYTIGTNRVIVNSDDIVRFGGLSVIDSGSTYGTGSLLWDSLNNRWIYQADDQAYNSAVIIAGPKHSGSLGSEPGLTVGRVPVATGDDHIDSRAASSSIYVDFATLYTTIENGLGVSGSVYVQNNVTASGFKGDGSQLTNVAAGSVAYTNITGLPTLVSASSQIDHNSTTNYVANQHVDHSTVSITAGAGLTGGGNITATRTLSVDSGSMLPYYSSSIFSTVSGDITISAGGVASIAANSVALGTDTTGNYAGEVTAGTGIVVGGSAGEGTSFSVTLDTGSATFTNGVVKSLPAGTYSSSAQLPAGTVSSSLQFNSLTSPFTGSFTGSFTGDGSGLTGIATVLAVTGSDGASITTGTVNLKTQAITYSAGEGIDISVAGQTVSIAGEDATSVNKGIASFNATNFTVTGGDVTSNNISINGTNVTLGGTRNITLQQITAQGASTTDQVTLAGGAIVHGVLFTSSSAASLTDGANQVVASIATGSYDSAMFDYVIKDGTNFRAGTVTSVWKAGTSSVEFTDTSTNDIGSTLNQSFTVDTSAGNARLKFTTTGGGTWTVKTAIRLL